MTAYQDWLTLREIDQQRQQSKGTAFRQFKALAPQLREARDYLVLNPEQHRDSIEQLRSAQRIYAGSVHAILLSPELAECLRQALGPGHKKSR